MFAKKTLKTPLAIKQFGNPTCPRAVTSPQPWQSFEASLSNPYEQGCVPCWGHHTHHHITHPHSQLSQKTKLKKQPKKKKKKGKQKQNNQLFWWLIPTTQTLLIWGGNSLAGACFYSVSCWGMWWGGFWEMSWGCQSCSLPRGSLRPLRCGPSRLGAAGHAAPSAPAWDAPGLHAGAALARGGCTCTPQLPYTHRHPCHSSLGSQAAARASIPGEESMGTHGQASPPAPTQGQDAAAKARPDLHHTLPGQAAIWRTSPSWLRGTFNHTQLSLCDTESCHGATVMPPGLAGGDRHLAPHGTLMIHHCPLLLLSSCNPRKPLEPDMAMARGQLSRTDVTQSRGLRVSLVTGSHQSSWPWASGMGKALGQVGTGWVSSWSLGSSARSCVSHEGVPVQISHRSVCLGAPLPQHPNRRLFFTLLTRHYHSVAIFYLCAVSVWNSLLWDSLG